MFDYFAEQYPELTRYAELRKISLAEGFNLRKFLATVAIIGFLSGPAMAGAGAEFGLDEADFTYVVKFVGAMYVLNNCTGYELDAVRANHWADQNGVDVKRLSLAIQAAQDTIADRPYDRENLDPRVTKAFLKIANGLVELTRTDGKPAICKNFGPSLVKGEFLKKQ